MDINNNSLNKYMHKEEIANVVSHIIGTIMGIVVCLFFIQKANQSTDSLSVASLWVYLLGVTSSYLVSSLYHACPAKKENSKLLLRKIDHAAIYWHIVGCYAPITFIAMYKYGVVGWGIFIFTLLCICAILGTILTFRKMKSHSYFKTACYVMMGLSILIAIKPFYDSVGFKVLLFLILEGISFIIGAVLYSFKKIKYIHSVFHIFVLFGDIFHMLAVWKIILIYC